MVKAFLNGRTFDWLGMMAIVLVVFACRQATQSSFEDLHSTKISDETFSQYVNDSGGLVVIDFWADWCGPCHMLAPTIAEIANETKGKVTVGKVDVDKNPRLSSRFKIASIPSILIFKDGEMVWRTAGVVPKSSIMKVLKEHGYDPNEKDQNDPNTEDSPKVSQADSNEI